MMATLMRCNTLLYILLLAACGPAVSAESDESDTTTSDTATDTDGDGSTGGETGNGETGGETGNGETGGETGNGEPEFGDGEDDCLGDESNIEAQSCMSLAAASLINVSLEYEGGDEAWNSGETLRVTLSFAAGEYDVDTPSIVAQVDQQSESHVSVPWIWSNWFYVFASEEVEYVISFVAQPDTPAGTMVALRLGAASTYGNLTQCDCPDFEIDAWTQWLTIE